MSSSKFTACYFFAFLLTGLGLSCTPVSKESNVGAANESVQSPYLTVLGVAQDAGYPQIGCQKTCCSHVHEGRRGGEKVVSLGIVDRKEGKNWLFEATPNFKSQCKALHGANPNATVLPSGIFLTHAHMGHYTGLMQLGREAIGASGVEVFAMPRMQHFLESNGPWDQLVKLNNIHLTQLKADSAIQISADLHVTPILVPHRDEYSETVGFRIHGPTSRILFIPDIDKWNKWDRSIVEEIAHSTHAFIDATFFDNAELPNRDMSEIPHPFVEESLQLFASLPASEKNKVHFIHFNHTNPLIWDMEVRKDLETKGYHVASEGDVVEL